MFSRRNSLTEVPKRQLTKGPRRKSGRTHQSSDFVGGGETALGIEVLEDRRMLAVLIGGGIAGGGDDLEALNNLDVPLGQSIGSEPTISIANFRVDDAAGDVQDVFRYRAHSTGKLILEAFATTPDVGIDVVDAGDNSLIGGVQTAGQVITLPVIEGDLYYLVVSDTVGGGIGSVYSMEIENISAPVPSGLALTPASDTGADNSDGVTADNTPTFVIQDDLETFLEVPFSDVQIGTIDSENAVGYDVDLVITNAGTGDVTVVDADRLGASAAWNATSTPLPDGDYIVSARTRVMSGSDGGVAMTGGFVDVIVVMDESGSMGDEQAFIGSFVQTLDAELLAAGVGTGANANQYGLVGYGGGGAGNLGRSIMVGGGLFGTDDEFDTASADLTLSGTEEDGFAAVEFALDNYAFRAGSTRLIVLVTDEDRILLDGTENATTFVDGLTAANATLVSVVNVDLRTAGNDPALALDFETNAYVEQPAGAFLESPGGSAFTGFDDTIADYVDTAFMVDGIVADLNQLRLGGNAAASFSAALIDGIVEVAGPTAPAGFSLLSEPIFVTIDTEAPATGTIDLLASSDTGTFSTDNVTSTRTPGFTGTGPANGIVHVFAQASDPTTGAAIGSPLLVGSGTVGSDVTDTVVGNGQGQWNVTTIPIDDGLWYFTARFEDDAGLLSDPVGVPALPAPVFGNQNFSFGSPATLTSDVSRANFNSFISLVGDAVGQMIPVVNVEATATTAHPVPASVSLSLTSPAGTTVGLSPTVPAGSFSGENAVGTWTLTASDLVNDGIDGTLTNFNLFVTTALPVVIDTIAPNPPILDLTSDSDSGRDNTDEITNDDTITVTMTTNDSAVSQTNLLFQDNLRYVVYDRFNTEAEFVLYDSSLDAAVESTSILGDLLTSQNFVTETLGTQFIGLNAPNQAVLAGGILADGIHELKLEVLDRAGNISQSFLLPLTVDTIAPPISFGLSTVASDGLFDGSDTGTAGDGTSFSDRITSDTAPTLWGMAEANTVVSLWLDANGDGLIQATGAAADIFLGQTVANPLDGNAAFPPGYWQISSAIDLNDLTTINATGGTFARDGARPLLVSAQDQAGNPVAAAGVIGPALNGTILDALTIAVDTQGPQITGVRINAEQTGQFGGYDLFDPKPSINNPTPLINSITINFQDLPARVDAAGTANDFIYPALDPTVAGTIGNYRVVGDHVGEVVINSATVDQAVKVSGTVTAAVSTTTFSDVGLVGAAAPPTVGDFVVFTSGANTTQTRLISAYIPGTGTIMVDNAYGAAPAVGDGYSIVTATSMLHAGSFLPSTPPSLLNTVTAPAVGANTASAFTIFPTFTLGGSFVSAPTPGDYLYFHTGVNAGQIRRITNDPSFNSTVTVASAFGAVPAIGDSFSVLRRSLAPGNFNTASVTLTFATPLPDDRFTLTVSDNLVDPAGNKLDGESNATSPAPTNGFPASVTLPTGDSVAGGAFAGRFTVDSRPEIGSFVSQNINIDTNGNFVWDPATSQIGGDATNVDLTFNMQVANANGTVGLGSYGNHDLVFAGKFGLNGVGIPSGFDTLAVYGFSVETNTRRWLVDTNHDGVITTGTDIISTQLPVAGFNEVGALPIAGNFDGNAANGDEIGLYFAGQWALDTNRNFVIDGADTFLNGNMFGHPIVGDFDGNGEDDLGVFNNNQFFFDMNVAGFDGNFENANTINWGFPGVLDRPVAADMDQDGIDDIGLWVPRNSAQDNRTIAEWYFLVSGNPLAFIVGGAAGTTALINHPFTPVPFGNDLYAEFGDELALPIVGNFDPPVAIEAADGQNVPDTGDFDGDGDMDGSDFLAWQRGYTMTGTPSMADGDGNSDGTVDQLDVELWAAAYQAAETSSLSQSNEGGADIGNQFDNGSDFLSWQRDLTSTNVAAAISSFDAELVAAAAASSRAPFAAPAREMAFADLGESDPFEFGEQAAAPQSADLALAAKIADDEVSAGGTANSDAAAYALALTLDDEGLLGDWL